METLDSIDRLDTMTHIDPIYPMKFLEPLGLFNPMERT